jgi:hypothetical protein
MAGMSVSRIALLAGAWLSAALAVWAALAVLNTLLLVPDNPDRTDSRNLTWKIGTAALCVGVSYLLSAYPGWPSGRRWPLEHFPF